MEALAGLIMLVLVLGFFFFIGLIWWKIFKRAGYHPALGLLVLVPIANIIILAILAFTEWPIQKELNQAKGATAKPSRLSAPFIILIIIITLIPIMGLLAAIAIPNYLKARLQASESFAEATVKTIGNAIEAYNIDKGTYPLSEDELRNSKAPYLSQSYNNQTIHGYYYFVDLTGYGYKITATPTTCGSAGIKIFRMETGGSLYAEKCK